MVHPSTPLATLPRDVIQRDGTRAAFDAHRIQSAIARAGAATGEFGEDEARLLTAQATKVLIHRFRGEAPAIEQVQDVVEQTLIAANHLQTARAYMAYRQRHATLRADRQTLVHVKAPSTNT
jgi:ribonucleoside-triphosphate reductase